MKPAIASDLFIDKHTFVDVFEFFHMVFEWEAMGGTDRKGQHMSEYI